MRPDRSVPSAVDALGRLVDEALTVGHIAAGPLQCVSPDDHPADAAAELTARGFDVAGVVGDRITMFVELDQLRTSEAATVAEAASPILASACVEKSLPLSHLFTRLQERTWVFVLDNGEVGQIVTYADLQAPAVGVAVLAYLTLIETGLRRLAEPLLGDLLLGQLTDERRERAEQLYEDKRRENAAIGYADCLYLADWLTLALSCDALAPIGIRTGKALEKRAGSFTVMRNSLAHGGTILDGGVKPVKALERVDRVRQFAEDIWQLVEAPQSQWDIYLGSTIVVPRTKKVLAGAEADALTGLHEPIHVLTAWNPGGTQRSRAENRRANQELRDVLLRRGLRPQMAICESPDERWRVESYAVRGLQREQAVELTARFGQQAMLELTDEELRVIEAPHGTVARSAPRRTS